jgi:hypothetical protein
LIYLEIYEIIHTMNIIKKNKALGWDSIPDNILNNSNNFELVMNLKIICQDIINSGKFPKFLN